MMNQHGGKLPRYLYILIAGVFFGVFVFIFYGFVLSDWFYKKSIKN